MVYAVTTTVPVDKTKLEIERTLVRYGATRFAYSSEPGRAVIMFEAASRRMRFILPLPIGDKRGDDQLLRSRWRALLLCLKAKLESVDSKIESFEEAFLAHVVMPDGRTVADVTVPQIAESYKSGKMPLLLLPPPQAGADG